MRVDIGAEFYVRVKPDMSSIALAAQTLGNRTNDARSCANWSRPSSSTALRSVAATMKLEELQEQRADFVKSVQDAVGADIQNNGLELESVSLTRLDQTDIKHFNPSNFFDAARSDDADQDHQGARAGAQPDRARHRGHDRAAGPGGAADAR